MTKKAYFCRRIRRNVCMTAREALKKYYGYESFRPLQEEIINSVLAGHDTLALLPTGGGKSLCFQIPTLVQETLCLVITPLIALMHDQVEHLLAREIRAAAIHMGMSYDEQRKVLDNCQFGPYRFLYVSPERLESADFRARLAQLPIGLIAVDEAHCVSQWGYDFRPSYLRIAQVWDSLPKDRHIPILALTATATPEVQEDIMRKLEVGPLRCWKLEVESQESGVRSQESGVESQKSKVGSREWRVFRQSFHRENLRYVVRRCQDAEDKRMQILRIVNGVAGTGIIYVRNRKRSREYAMWLQTQGVSADFYNAGLSSEERALHQKSWLEGRTRVLVCTNAFGMGIDKPDVRFVVHLDLPDNVESYFQEAGRAGRDKELAYCVLLYAAEDKARVQRRVAMNYPPQEFINGVYMWLSNHFGVGEGSGLGHTFTLHMDEFCQIYRLPVQETYSALHLLSQAGWIHFEEEQEKQARVQIKVSRKDLYDYHLNDEQDSLLHELMRRYTGIFSDLQYVSKFDHKTLASLAERGIITYIPRTIACAVTYTKERQAEVYIPSSIYDERRAQYATRLQSMLGYAEQAIGESAEQLKQNEQYLLAYLGEGSTHTA